MLPVLPLHVGVPCRVPRRFSTLCLSLSYLSVCLSLALSSAYLFFHASALLPVCAREERARERASERARARTRRERERERKRERERARERERESHVCEPGDRWFKFAVITSYLTTPHSAWSVCAAEIKKNATDCTRVRAALLRDTFASIHRQCVCARVRECVCVRGCVYIHTSALFLKSPLYSDFI